MPKHGAPSSHVQGASSLLEGGPLQNPAVKLEPGLQQDSQDTGFTQGGFNNVPSSEQIMAELLEKEGKS